MSVTLGSTDLLILACTSKSKPKIYAPWNNKIWLFIHNYKNPPVSFQPQLFQVRLPTEYFPVQLLAALVQYHKVSLWSLQQQTPWPSCDQWVHWKKIKISQLINQHLIRGRRSWKHCKNQTRAWTLWYLIKRSGTYWWETMLLTEKYPLLAVYNRFSESWNENNGEEKAQNKTEKWEQNSNRRNHYFGILDSITNSFVSHNLNLDLVKAFILKRFKITK